MEFIDGEKGKPLLLYNGYKFRRHKTLKDEIQRWTCCNNQCKCYFKLNSANEIIAVTNQHNHDKCDTKVVNRQKLCNALKRKAIDDISAKPSMLIRMELMKGDVSTLDCNDLGLIRHNMHRARLSVHRTLPKSREETHSAIKFKLTKTDVGSMVEMKKTEFVSYTSGNTETIKDVIVKEEQEDYEEDISPLSIVKVSHLDDEDPMTKNHDTKIFNAGVQSHTCVSKQTPRDFLREFIEMYESFTCLWLIKSKEYSDRIKKDLAYKQLVEKYREFDPSADRNTVVKKINALRTVYKKELAKVNNSLNSGASADQVYKPSLWYFDLLHFLNNHYSKRPTRNAVDYGECAMFNSSDAIRPTVDYGEFDNDSGRTSRDYGESSMLHNDSGTTSRDYGESSMLHNDSGTTSRDYGECCVSNNHDTARSSRNTMDYGDDGSRQDEDSQSTDLDHFHQQELNTPALQTSGDEGSQSVALFPRVPRPKRKKNVTQTDEVLQHLKAMGPEDEFDAYGRYLAHKLRSLKGNQAIFARKLINDVIYEGELELLDKNFIVVKNNVQQMTNYPP